MLGPPSVQQASRLWVLSHRLLLWTGELLRGVLAQELLLPPSVLLVVLFFDRFWIRRVVRQCLLLAELRVRCVDALLQDRGVSAPILRPSRDRCTPATLQVLRPKPRWNGLQGAREYEDCSAPNSRATGWSELEERSLCDPHGRRTTRYTRSDANACIERHFGPPFESADQALGPAQEPARHELGPASCDGCTPRLRDGRGPE
jgi:hypothetical protein